MDKTSSNMTKKKTALLEQEILEFGLETMQQVPQTALGPVGKFGLKALKKATQFYEEGRSSGIEEVACSLVGGAAQTAVIIAGTGVVGAASGPAAPVACFVAGAVLSKATKPVGRVASQLCHSTFDLFKPIPNDSTHTGQPPMFSSKPKPPQSFHQRFAESSDDDLDSGPELGYEELMGEPLVRGARSKPSLLSSKQAPREAGHVKARCIDSQSLNASLPIAEHMDGKKIVGFPDTIDLFLRQAPSDFSMDAKQFHQTVFSPLAETCSYPGSLEAMIKKVSGSFAPIVDSSEEFPFRMPTPQSSSASGGNGGSLHIPSLQSTSYESTSMASASATDGVFTNFTANAEAAKTDTFLRPEQTQVPTSEGFGLAEATQCVQVARAALDFFCDSKSAREIGVVAGSALSIAMAVSTWAINPIGSLLALGSAAQGLASLFSGDDDEENPLFEAIRQLAEMLQHVRQEMHQRFDRVEKKLSKIDRQLTWLDFQIDRLHSRLDRTAQRNQEFHQLTHGALQGITLKLEQMTDHARQQAISQVQAPLLSTVYAYFDALGAPDNEKLRQLVQQLSTHMQRTVYERTLIGDRKLPRWVMDDDVDSGGYNVNHFLSLLQQQGQLSQGNCI